MEKLLAHQQDYPNEIEDLLCLTEDTYQNEILMHVDTTHMGITVVPLWGMHRVFLAYYM